MKTNIEIRVGLFAVIAILLLVWGWFWLKSFSLFHAPQRFIVEFHDVEGLHKAAPVNINGVRVGDVEQIELKGRGKVLVSLRITNEGITIPQGSAITIQTLGLVGAKYVEITLPESKAQPAADIEPNTIVQGQDPVRAELIFNQIATELGSFTNIFASQDNKNHLVDTLKNSGEAIRNINELTKKFNNDFKHFDNTINTINSTVQKYNSLAGDLHNTANKAGLFFDNGTSTLKSVHKLSDNLEITSAKVNKLLDNTSFAGDVKESLHLANQTMQKIDSIVSTLNRTLSDRDLRKDLINILVKLNTSTKQINQSMVLFNSLAKDSSVRSDAKNLVVEANRAITNANKLLNNVNLNGDLKKTILDVQKAANDIDLTAKRLNLVLSKRSPILHLLFGRNKLPSTNSDTLTPANTGNNNEK